MGTIITVVWDAFEIQNNFQQYGWIKNVDAVYPALLISLVGLIAVSLASRPPEPKKWQPFFEQSTKEVVL